MPADDQLYIVLTTDHGMTRVKTLVNIHALLSSPPPRQARIVTSGPLAYVYLDALPPGERGDISKRILADLKKCDFVSVYTHETLPKSWRLDHPSRVGQITLMLDPGYTFSTKHEQATYAIGPGDEPQGMHGYPPPQCADMRGLCLFWRYPDPIGGRNLGTVHTEQLHPTVARLLGIRPADAAKAAPVLDPKATHWAAWSSI
jgi:hypothetical protein